MNTYIHFLLNKEITDPTGNCFTDGNDMVLTKLIKAKQIDPDFIDCETITLFRKQQVEISYRRSETKNISPEVFDDEMIAMMINIQDRDYDSTFNPYPL